MKYIREAAVQWDMKVVRPHNPFSARLCRAGVLRPRRRGLGGVTIGTQSHSGLSHWDPPSASLTSQAGEYKLLIHSS